MMVAMTPILVLIVTSDFDVPRLPVGRFYQHVERATRESTSAFSLTLNRAKECVRAQKCRTFGARRFLWKSPKPLRALSFHPEADIGLEPALSLWRSYTAASGKPGRVAAVKDRRTSRDARLSFFILLL